MHTLPDLTKDGPARIHVANITGWKQAPGSVFFDYDLALTIEIGKGDSLGILPEPIRHQRVALLQAFEGGKPITPSGIKYNEGGYAQLHHIADGEVDDEPFASDLRFETRRVVWKASEGKIVVGFAVRLTGPAELASQLIVTRGTDLVLNLKYDEPAADRHLDLFTNLSDLPKPDPVLEPNNAGELEVVNEGTLPPEAGESMAAVVPAKRRGKKKTATALPPAEA